MRKRNSEIRKVQIRKRKIAIVCAILGTFLSVVAIMLLLVFNKPIWVLVIIAILWLVFSLSLIKLLFNQLDGN